MSIESKTESINIYLRDQDTKTRILSDLSAERKYIILQNDTLQAENKTLNSKINELENQIDELETDSGKMERSMTYIKGMLKNFVEVDKLYRIIDKEQTAMQFELIKIHKDTKFSFFIDLVKYKIISILLFLICYLINTKPSYVTFFVLDNWLMIYIFLRKRWNGEVVKEPEVVKESRMKIGEIHKAQDYITDLIDNC